MSLSTDTQIKSPSRNGSAAPAERGLGRLAGRIASRTTDLIVIGVVLVGGLTIGRQLVAWWRTEPVSVGQLVNDPGAEAWADEQAPVQLDFGDWPVTLSRQTVVGDFAAAEKIQLELCRRVVSTAGFPPASDQESAESEMLAHVAGLTPIASEPGSWEVHRLGDRFSTVLGVRHFAPGDDATAGVVTRLICWGLALPLGTDRWTIFTFVAAGSGSRSPGELPDVPLPPGARRNLAIRDSQGGGMIGFSGRGNPQVWSEYFESELARRGWVAAGRWSAEAGTNSRWNRFQLADRSASGTVEIQFSDGGDGSLTGLIRMVP